MYLGNIKVCLSFLGLLLTTGFLTNSANSECWFEESNSFNFIDLDEFDEDVVGIGEILEILNPTNGSVISSITDDTEYLEFVLDEEEGVVNITLRRTLEDYLLEECRELDDTCFLQTQLLVTCEDGSNNFYVHFTVRDINNQPPQFLDQPYESEISIPWPVLVPLNKPTIQINDLDFEEANANLTFTVNNDKVKVDPKRLGGKPYTYEINLYLKNENDQLTADESLLVITATDGLNPATSTLTLDITPTNVLPPRFSSTFYFFYLNQPMDADITFYPVGSNQGEEGISAEDTEFPGSPVEYSIGLNGDQDLVGINPDGTVYFKQEANSDYFAGVTNRVVTVEIVVKETEGQQLESKSVLIIYFTYEEATTTLPPEGTTTIEPCPTSTTAEAPTTGSCPEVTCPDIIPTTSYEPCACTTIEPPECSCSSPNTEATSEGPTTECSTTTCPECPSPPTECPTSTSAEWSTTCPPTECPTSTSTEWSTITCPPTECPTSTSTEWSTTCPECPSTAYASSTTSTESSATVCPECPTTPYPTSTSTDCPITTCPECLSTTTPCPTSATDCPPTTCPDCLSTTTPCPTSTTDCPTTTCPDCGSTTCPPTTTTECPPNNFTSTCAPCTTTCSDGDDDDECAGDGGFIAGIAVTTVLFLGSAAAAVYFWMQLRKVPPNPFRDLKPEMTGSESLNQPGTSKRFSIEALQKSASDLDVPSSSYLEPTSIVTATAPAVEPSPSSPVSTGSLGKNNQLMGKPTSSIPSDSTTKILSPDPSSVTKIPPPDYATVDFKDTVEIINEDELDYDHGEDENEYESAL